MPDPSPIESVSLPPPPPAAALPTSRPRSQVPTNSVHDTLGWLWKDTAGRLLPFAIAAAAYARFSGQGTRGLGLTRDGWARDLLVGTALGVPGAGAAIAFRRWVAPGYRLPTKADQTVQTAFYFGLNAPVEELFWRGTVQNLAIAGLRRLPSPWLRRAAPGVGWAATTAVFGAYHRLGNWSWRSIAGVTVAGGLFGGAYLASRKRRSLLPAIVIHGFMTAGFLSWGDLALHLLRRRKSAADSDVR